MANSSGPTGITLNAGAGGPTVGADSDGTYTYEIQKVGFSASGSTPQQVSTTNPLPVSIYIGGSTANAVPVNIVAGGGSGGTSDADASAYTRGTTPGTPVGGVVESAQTGLSTGQFRALSLDTTAAARVNVTNAVASGTAGAASTSVISVQGISGMTPVLVNAAAMTAGGASYSCVILPGTPAVQTAKSSAGTVSALLCFNISATPVYLKLFDTSSVTLGTTSANLNFVIPGNTAGDGFVVPLRRPIQFNSAIKYAVTGGIGLADNTSITANSVVVNLLFD